MKKILILMPFFITSVLAYSQQSREDVKIYIPMPMGGNAAQQVYFYENIKMEAFGAGYSVTDSAIDSDYILNLYIRPNMVMYLDGSEELAPPDEPQYFLELNLVKTETGDDLVRFSFSFTELEEMDNYNLYLFYQAIANVPFTKVTDITEITDIVDVDVEVEVDDDLWRNKWLYFRFSLDYNIPIFNPGFNKYWEKRSKEGNDPPYALPIDHQIPLRPGFSLGVELHFLNWMSAELGLNLLIGNVVGISYNNALVGTFDLSLKFPLKPLKHYMIEPFLGIAFPLALMGTNLPIFGLQGGIQVATKAGNMGGFFISLRGEYDFGKVNTNPPAGALYENGTPLPNIPWTRFVIGFSAGYKLGIVNRKKN
jgi:hypothetical protein